MSIDYDKLLDKWYEEIVRKADKMKDIMDEEEYDKDGYLVSPPTLRYCQAKEFRDGLYYATAILSRLEHKEKIKNKTK